MEEADSPGTSPDAPTSACGASGRGPLRADRRAGVPAPDADAPGVTIEDYDLAENLMIEVAVLASGGQVIRRGVPPGREMRDLAGFEACLIQAQRILLA